MEKRCRDIIRSNHPLLVKELGADVDDICSFLYKSRIISKRMMENILEDNNTPDEKATALLDLIVKLRPVAFEMFYLAVLESKLYLAADILKPIKSPHETSYLASTQSTSSDLPPDEDDEVAGQVDTPTKDVPPGHSNSSASSQRSFSTDIHTSWPNSGILTKEQIKIQNVQPNTAMYQEYVDSLTPLGERFTYQMKGVNRGRVVIINNEHFAHVTPTVNEGDKVKSLPERKGSSCDKVNLVTLFQQLWFTVMTYNDLTKENMETIFQEECALDHSQSDCFILVILSHGQKGMVFGTDGYIVQQKNNEVQLYNCIKVKSIKNMFCGIRSLTGKPKLFFIQACRGDAYNKGAEENATDARLETGDADMDVNVDDVRDAISEFDERDESDGPGRNIPEECDYLLAMSTVSGCVSYRNASHGSWFIQALVYNFSNNAHLYDLNKLLTLTNNCVSSAETIHGKKQVAEKRDTLRKSFYFFPGLHPALPPPSQS